MRVLIAGAAGLIGREAMSAAWPGEWTVIGLDHAALDIVEADAVTAVARRESPDLIVNLAAYTAVDRAESERDRAYAVNAQGPANLGRASAELGIPLIHFSTDYVFDGAKGAPYVEDDRVAPLSVYGASKEAGERAVREAALRHIVLRTSWVYGDSTTNFVRTMLGLAETRDEMRVVGDQHGSPTWARDLAGALVRLAAALAAGSRAWGTYHFCGDGGVSRAEYAEAIFERAASFGLRRPRVIRVGTADMPTHARRPADSRLDCGKIARVFGIHAPPWRDSLSRMVDEYLKAIRQTARPSRDGAAMSKC